MKQASEAGSRIDRAIEAASRRMASRFSRRSLFGQIGKGSVVLAAGSTAGLVFDVAPAAALTCPGGPYSVTCDQLAGGGNYCPSDTCACGYWVACRATPCSDATRGLNAKYWNDCCKACSANCQCVNGYYYCCFPKDWNQGCGNNTQLYIKCRHYSCGYEQMCA